MTPTEQHELISFGTFEVDLNSGEIRKAGMRVRLQSQPFRILAALLSRPGQVITREELQVEIWGEHTIIDFERGIGTAINKLREALGDSAEHPRYIETLAKRGFRFIAPIVIEAPHEAVCPAQPDGVDLSYTTESAKSPALAFAPAMIELAPSLAHVHSPTLPPGAWSAWRSLLRPWTILWLCLAAVVLMGVSALVTWRLLRPGHVLLLSRLTQLTHSSEIYDGPPNPENLLTLVTDGPRIYTSFLVDAHPEIASLDLSGTQLQPVNLSDGLGSVSIAAISRDGSTLIVRERHSRDSEQPLWIVPTVGSSALRIGDVLAHDATFMPGDRSILYAAGNELGIAQLDAGAPSKYVTLPGRAFWLRWSPSGNLLRFTLIDPLTHLTSLWELDARTHTFQQLHLPELTGFSVCCGSWTADGSLYVFQASNERESDIWSVGTGAHSQLTRLTNGPLHYMSPMTSRTEKTIFFVGRESPAGTRFYDRKLQQFVPAPSFLERARRVTYSRDGKWVAWVDVGGCLWRARSTDGTGLLQLTRDALNVFMAQWSPDGSQLILMARESGKTWQIYSVDAAGGVIRRVLADQRNLADPDWSADGRQLIFGREADLMGKEDGPHDLQIYDLASHISRTLPGSENLFSPRWSPDGRWIVALSLDQTRMLLYDVRGRSWSTLFTGSAADPVWSRDSESIYFNAFADPNSAIFRIPVTGGAPQSVADLSKLGLPALDNYFFGGVTPEGAPIIQPRIGTGNLFSVRLSQ